MIHILTFLIHLLSSEADNQQIDAPLVISVAKVESDFRPHAKSSAKALGLMQVKCGTARQLGMRGSCKKLYNPRVNVKYGVAYLKLTLHKAHGDECVAAGLYNMGINSAHPNMDYCGRVLRVKALLTRQAAPDRTPTEFA